LFNPFSAPDPAALDTDLTAGFYGASTIDCDASNRTDDDFEIDTS
jgi:hypothetical protein